MCAGQPPGTRREAHSSATERDRPVRFLSVGSAMMCASVNRRGGGEEEVATVVTTAAVVLALLLLAVVALLWRLYNDGMRRADAAARLVAADAAVVAALDTDPELLRWLIDRRVFLCGPTGFGVLASAALFAATDRALVADVEQVRAGAAAAHRAAAGAVDALNLSSTHLQRFLSARRRELEALETFRAT